jgi:hypothetical protein
MPIDSISSDISIGVPDNIKEKIVKSEYIDIGSLLPNNIHIENSQKLTIYQGELVLQKMIGGRHINKPKLGINTCPRTG